jgi:hypothetical protein
MPGAEGRSRRAKRSGATSWVPRRLRPFQAGLDSFVDGFSPDRDENL